MIFLTGMAGSGKSTAGKRLAAKLGWKFSDTDRLIERRAGMTVAEIFRRWGEKKFRRLESLALRSLKDDRTVVATGGGMVLRLSNRQWMKRHGVIVYLAVGTRALVARLNPREAARRPLMSGGPQRIREMARKRAKVYMQADIRVRALGSISQVVSKIHLKIKEKRPQVLHDKTAR